MFSRLQRKDAIIQRLVASVQVTSCCNEQEDSKEDENKRKVSAIDTRAQHKALSVEDVTRKFGVGL
jgi:hypothetical protein